MWSDRFEGERSQLAELQVELVARIANALDVQLPEESCPNGSRSRGGGASPIGPDRRAGPKRLRLVAAVIGAILVFFAFTNFVILRLPYADASSEAIAIA